MATYFTRSQAIEWLERRYAEQVERYPLLREQVPMDLYVRRNLVGALSIDWDVAELAH